MDIQVYDIAILPLIVGLVSMTKAIGLPQRFAPFIAILLGVLAGIFYVAPHNMNEGILVGIALGLAASGLYSSTKTLAEKRSSTK
ncbi:hypothetical protein [Longirhabdus pacifica]|uniref:hypothetical protein n=1 Tax=Longirhabdus pacifica TaxID=2305227 RepID=UPI00197D1588|nr:hypothetical protein [Longirhabdus pacifica]